MDNLGDLKIFTINCVGGKILKFIDQIAKVVVGMLR